jgi:CRP-like cAMP-binding protein
MRDQSSHKRNRLLAALPKEDYQALTAHATVTSLKFAKTLYLPDTPMENAYFPLDCMVSVLVGTSADAQVELATIGNEGLVGIPILLDVNRALGTHLVQVPGKALRVDAKVLRKESNARPAIRRLMERYIYALMCQIVYAGSCNRLHSMEERCARWLLLTHDRAGADTFPLTQDLLAEMLAVRRATVNLAIGILKKAGFIRYTRGRMTIIDRAGLESVACPCYEIIRQEYKRLGLVSKN